MMTDARDDARAEVKTFSLYREYEETRDFDAPFDPTAEILQREEMARRLAREFKRSRKYPIEAEELESEALVALTQAASDYPDADTPMPFGAFASQRIMWRLEDFIQAWFRLARVDHSAGREEVRRLVGLTAVEGTGGRPTGRRRVEHPDLNTNLYFEDCIRLADSVLNERQKRIIDMRYMQHMNMKEIAESLGMTHLLARQVHCEAIAALRQSMNGVQKKAHGGTRAGVRADESDAEG
jgi:RNA polymerase sigma factor (sigma-70 family)